MAEYQGAPVYKMVFVSPNAAGLREPMRVLGDEFDFCLQGTDQLGAINGELINKAFNKGLAVERLCQHLNVPIQNTIAFGDSMNDLEMLQAAGLGICMANGSADLKKIADEVCPAVDEDGLYKAFVQHGLIGTSGVSFSTKMKIPPPLGGGILRISSAFRVNLLETENEVQ